MMLRKPLRNPQSSGNGTDTSQNTDATDARHQQPEQEVSDHEGAHHCANSEQASRRDRAILTLEELQERFD